MKLTVIILLIMIILTVVYSKYSQNKLLKELYRLAYLDDDEEGFILMLSSIESQMLMSDISGLHDFLLSDPHTSLRVLHLLLCS